MTNPTEKELTRRQVENLYYSLQAVKSMPVRSQVRYGLARTLSSITPEMEATQVAFPRPTEMVNGAELEWEKSRADHMTAKVKVSVWPIDEIPDIDPKNLIEWRPGLTPVQANLLHQDIVESLIVLLPTET